MIDYVKIIKDNELYLGALYKFEGELMKITIRDPDVFHVGDQLSCTYYNRFFETKILKKQDYQLYVLVPQTYEQFPNEKRKHPRIKVDLTGFLQDNNVKECPIKVNDISRMGFGVSIQKNESPEFKQGDICKIKIITTETQLMANLIVRHYEALANENRLGCELHSISNKDEFELRKLILIEQLKSNMV